LPVPVAGDTVTHAAFDVTVTDVFDVTATAVAAPAAGGAHEDPDNVSVGGTPACVTARV